MTPSRVLDDDIGPDVIADLTARAQATNWLRDGVCGAYGGLGASVWFPDDRPTTMEQREQVALAVKLCRTCRVMDLCRVSSFAAREEFGVWGGVDENERKTVLKQGPDATRALLLEGVEQTAALRLQEDLDHREFAA